MRFTINLATRTYLNQRLINQISSIVIALLVVALGWNITRISWNVGEQQRLAAEVKALEETLNIRPGGVSEKDYSRQQSRIRFFNEVIDRKGARWLNLLDLIESATPEGIALSIIAPGKKDGEWKLEGNARSFTVVRKYVEKLEGTKAFTNVLLLSHRDMTIGETGHGVQFSISCTVQF